MLELLNLDNVLFLDVETAPMVAEYKQLPPAYKKLWDHKTQYMMKREEDTPETIFQKAGIFAEFAKVICVSTGVMRTIEGKRTFRIKSFSGDDEKKVLEDLATMLNTSFGKKEQMLCGHNIKEFDIPFLSRRMMVNGIKHPAVLDLSGKKPWEVGHLDTMELWKFGDYKNYTSLELLATLFNIPSPKEDIEGSDVARVYWIEKDLPRIVEYCQRDVFTVAQLMLKYQGKPLIKEEDLVISK
ncbi:MAG TPA: 3'-5' exonuclease [Bacteroidales bacterium]|nr:3'-5' exonuclease [Bacteroidales bacterium]HPS18008.1 3'-5' exonuclease [Bacteroidales bacterium]